MVLMNREKSFAWVRQDSGGFVDDPRDSEGPTHHGVGPGLLSLWLGREATYSNVRDLDFTDALEVYRECIWDPLRCNELPLGVDYFAFDCGICCGVEVTKRWLQMVVGIMRDQGMSHEVIQRAHARDSRGLVEGLEFLRRRRLKSHPGWPLFQEAWTNRVNRAKRRALAMAESSGARRSCG